MAEVIFRLPGKEMYSYAEVKFDEQDYLGKEPEEVRNLLNGALSDLNATFPSASGTSSAGSSQGAPSGSQSRGGQAPSCEHGQRVLKEGNSSRGHWSAWMCPNGDWNNRCKPIDAKTGKSW